MDSIEKDPHFTPEIKLQDIDSDKSVCSVGHASGSSGVSQGPSVQSQGPSVTLQAPEAQEEGDLGLGLFQETPIEKSAKGMIGLIW